ncbi:MmgE/PrpD family protein [Humitalea sp. 24SJ18S-53]|uniref:MmgE/PrpD family protein n=1 Tax=Humitalea sp. 24SJ18S-53 TaxID=3422307 RepID=UPI003D6770AA
MNPLPILAAHGASWATRPLPDALAHHARRALVDWFAALIPGCDRAPASLLAAALAPSRGPGRAICYVDGTRGALRHAALLNATASHIVEFDDIFRDAGYHPGCPVIGAAVAAAQDTGADMDGLLRAIIAGYEVSCRIGLAVAPSHYRHWHTTGTVGTFGATAAVALLLGCDTEKMGHAIATAATMAGGLREAFAGSGMSKPMHPGHAADAGSLAAIAAAAGVTGAPNVLHGPAGFAAATSDSTGRWETAFVGLDDWFAIERMTIKNHGCCGHIFAALDAVSVLRDAHGFGPDDIRSIEVAGYGATKGLCDRPEAATEQEARFSAQYCIAALLYLGGVRLEAFTPERLADPVLRGFMPRVSVVLDPEAEAAFPGRRSATVTITLADGRVLKHFQPTRIGDPDAPLSDAQLGQKFMELTVPVIGQGPADALLHNLWTGRAVPGEIAMIHARRAA